jgi:endogenous inhibitor of DNA gyrase (YacG/DUF329 family)
MTQPKCPMCSKPLETDAYRPFCSRRCADLDLQRWLTGRYVVPAAADDDQDESLPFNPDED